MKRKPKILIYDIETAPNLAYVWGKYDQNVIAFAREWSLLSFAYKWAGDKQVRCLTREGQPSDRKLVRELHKLFSQADIVVAHNGDQFDQKKVAARMVFYGMKPPKTFASVDTKKVAKNYFQFNSNRLDDLGQHLGLGRKQKTDGFDLWLGCMSGDKASWRLMREYNMRDVELLEKVYQRFLPWIQNHPNVAKLLNPNEPRAGVCPSCGSDNVQRRGFRATHRQIKRVWNCQACGGWFQTGLKLHASEKGAA